MVIFNKKQNNNPALKIAFIYLIVSVLWILFSDKLASTFTTSYDSYIDIQVLKGLAFVVITSSLIYFLINKDYKLIANRNKSLRESEDRWQFALEGSGDGVWDWNAQTNEVYFSPQWKRMLGYTETDIENNLSSWEKLIHPDDKNYVYEELNKLLTGEIDEYRTQHRLKCKDGNYMWILDRGKIFSCRNDNKPLRIIGTHTDIDKQKSSEIELIELSDFKNLVFQAADLGIWRHNIPKDSIFLDERAQRFYGIQKERVNVKEILEIVHPDDLNKLTDEMGKFINPNSNGKIKTQYRVVHNDNSVHWLEVITRIEFDGKERIPVFGYGTVKDITERKRAEEELRELKDDLANQVENKTRELKERIDELERFHEATIDREMRMKELRDEINRLKSEKAQ